MKKIIILGSGKIGSTAACMLQESLKFQAKTQSDHQMLVPNFSPLGSSGAEILRGG